MEDRAVAWSNWRRFREASLGEIAVVSDHFEAAARLLDRPDLGLRPGDALHIAIAESGGLRLVTFDKRMADAALQLGVQAEAL